jgi:hypothetical protein
MFCQAGFDQWLMTIRQRLGHVAKQSLEKPV